jgi:phosphoribosylformylglycinamidine synthase subunit PurS
MKVRVDVNLKAGVLDPQGKAVAGALHNLGFDGVTEARVGKVIELTMNTKDADSARQQAVAMAEHLLANAVIEDYHITVL